MIASADILILGGTVFDGSGSLPVEADVAVAGDRIGAVGPAGGVRAGRVIDARGLVVAPGFIDTHAHSDFTLLADPRAQGKIAQGVTTEISGNCGLSAAPLAGQVLEKRIPDLEALGIPERWSRLVEYFHFLEARGIALNTATLAGHGNIRGAVIGYGNRVSSADDLARMSVVLGEAIEDGAIGLSTGLIYPPGIYSNTEELVRLGGLLRKKELIYTSHMRSEGDGLLEAIGEVITIGKETGVQVHISHIKAAGEKNWGKAEAAVGALGAALETGVRLSCDWYPYTASSTDLDSLLPAWAYEGGDEAELQRLRTPGDRERLRREVEARADTDGYWEKVRIASVASERNRWMEGKSVSEITPAGGDAAEFILDLLMEERLRVGAIFRSMSEKNSRMFLSLPYCMIGSDSSARSFDGPTRTGKPHPRTFGTFPRFFRRYVLDEGLMDLSEAVRRATMLPARTFRLKDRGQIRQGMYADIVIFDPARLADRATFEDPYQRPNGIAYVLVNGQPVIWEGSFTGAMPGRVLRG